MDVGQHAVRAGESIPVQKNGIVRRAGKSVLQTPLLLLMMTMMMMMMILVHGDTLAIYAIADKMHRLVGKTPLYNIFTYDSKLL